MIKRIILFIVIILFVNLSGITETNITNILDATFTFEQLKDSDPIIKLIGKNSFNVVSNLLEGEWSSDVNIDIQTETNLDFGTSLDFGFETFPFKVYLLTGGEKRDSLNLEYRINGGIGGKYYFIKNDTVNWSVSLIPLFLWEKYLENTEYINCRLSFRHKLVLMLIDKTVNFSSVVFYQPLWTDILYSFIINADNELSFKYSDNVSLLIKYDFDLDINTAVNVDIYKHYLSCGFRFNF